MPYSNIVYIKLFLDLLDDDDRFLYQLSERQQLLYVKLLYLAGKTKNRIPIKYAFISDKINYKYGEETLLKDMQLISELYSKFNMNCEHCWFDNFEEIHNYILGSPKEIQRKSKGSYQNKNKKKKKNKNKEEEKETTSVRSCDLEKAIRDFEDMRKKVKKPLTEKSREMFLKKLDELGKDDDQIKIKIIDQSVYHCWLSVYELKGDNRGQSESRDREGAGKYGKPEVIQA